MWTCPLPPHSAAVVVARVPKPSKVPLNERRCARCTIVFCRIWNCRSMDAPAMTVLRQLHARQRLVKNAHNGGDGRVQAGDAWGAGGYPRVNFLVDAQLPNGSV